MRLLSVGNFSGPSWDGSIPDEEHIAAALERQGHEVFRCQRETMAWADLGYDFTLIAQWDLYDVQELMKLPQPLVYWAFDYQKEGQDWHEELVGLSTLYLSKRISDSFYKNWQWLSQDFAPKFLYKSPQLHVVEKDIDVLFTGSYLDWATERNLTLMELDKRFELVIHSVNNWPGFTDVRPPLMDGSLPALYARAKVIISIDHTIEAGYWSDRNAQIIACGRKPLFRYVPLSEARFADRVDYFYNIEDCVRQVEAQLEQPQYVSPSMTGLYVDDRVQDLLTIVKGIL